ncbi:N-acetyltransferase family protein [Hydrocarboniphaga sp.]|uniref:GNAT family N-acetyltransferase n=1 Tax=Hydrocarboniphaga sp. TaxID=2033016 RepID=UPI003D0996B5
MRFVECTHERHAAAILEIFNDAILNSTALYDYRARTPENMVSWFAAKSAGGFPVIGVEDGHGALMGFASYGTFRAWPAYKYSVEHSVYVHRDHRGKGLGLALMQRLIARAAERDVHVMIGGIDVSNAASVAMHRKLGFVHAGTITQAGFKFGRWLDLGFYQLTLATPLQPVDG